ncbi:MAG: PQQ-binding-like beta-propeller repeat protein [candidate division WOR-3 bacterium]|nr:PQQ-binding-like beta-propeller repeat protein [candidate division WOR-3 bacterium]
MRKSITLVILTIGFLFAENLAPITPDSILTQLFGDTVAPIDFTVQTTDPDKDKIAYQFDWGDGNFSAWSEFTHSGYVYSEKYQYKSIGTFYVRVRVKDEKGNISDWSSSQVLTIVPNLLKWQFSQKSGSYSAIAIGPTKEIYFTCEDGSLYAINPDGSPKWKFSAVFAIYSSPAVDKNGIYITSTDGRLYAIDFEGKERWQFKAGNSIYSSPAIGKGGTVYFGCDDGKVYAVSSTGKLLWTYQTGDEIAGSPVIDADGTIYVASDAIYALTPKGKIKWTFKPPEENEAYFFGSPSIGNDDAIYVGGTDGALYAVTKEGRLKWIAPTPDEDAIRGPVAIGNNGIIYFGAEDGLLYKKEVYGEVLPVFETDYYLFSGPAIDSLGNIYFVSDDGYFYVINQKGKLLFKWMIADDSKEMMYSPSPVIDNDGTVYVGSWQGKLYAFNGFAPPAKSAWPLIRYNQQNTGRKDK